MCVLAGGGSHQETLHSLGSNVGVVILYGFYCAEGKAQLST